MPVTAYFAFSEAHRLAAREELQAASDSDQKISVAEVAKVLGQKWRALDDAEKDRYKDIAQERNKAVAAAAENKKQAESVQAEKDQRNGSSHAGPDGEGDAREGRSTVLCDSANNADGRDDADALKAAALPVSVVKRIMCIDEEVDRTSAGAVRAIAKATELWLAAVASKAMVAAGKAKRKTLKFSDIQMVVSGDKRLVEMGLQEVFDHEDTFADARGENNDGEERPEDRPTKKHKKDEKQEVKARPITAFFKNSVD